VHSLEMQIGVAVLCRCCG